MNLRLLKFILFIPFFIACQAGSEIIPPDSGDNGTASDFSCTLSSQTLAFDQAYDYQPASLTASVGDERVVVDLSGAPWMEVEGNVTTISPNSAVTLNFVPKEPNYRHEDRSGVIVFKGKYTGESVDAYHKQQFNYHVQAMQLGHALATVYVGIGHMQGYVTSQNNQMAFNCFAKAVELGEEFLGAFHLARCYHFGIGVDVDENCAVLYYTMSAERGNVSAMLALAQIYQDGLGSIPKDQQKSAKYLFMSGVGRP